MPVTCWRGSLAANPCGISEAARLPCPSPVGSWKRRGSLTANPCGRSPRAAHRNGTGAAADCGGREPLRLIGTQGRAVAVPIAARLPCPTHERRGSWANPCGKSAQADGRLMSGEPVGAVACHPSPHGRTLAADRHGRRTGTPQGAAADRDRRRGKWLHPCRRGCLSPVGAWAARLIGEALRQIVGAVVLPVTRRRMEAARQAVAARFPRTCPNLSVDRDGERLPQGGGRGRGGREPLRRTRHRPEPNPATDRKPKVGRGENVRRTCRHIGAHPVRTAHGCACRLMGGAPLPDRSPQVAHRNGTGAAADCGGREPLRLIGTQRRAVAVPIAANPCRTRRQIVGAVFPCGLLAAHPCRTRHRSAPVGGGCPSPVGAAHGRRDWHRQTGGDCLSPVGVTHGRRTLAADCHRRRTGTAQGAAVRAGRARTLAAQGNARAGGCGAVSARTVANPCRTLAARLAQADGRRDYPNPSPFRTASRSERLRLLADRDGARLRTPAAS